MSNVPESPVSPGQAVSGSAPAAGESQGLTVQPSGHAVRDAIRSEIALLGKPANELSADSGGDDDDSAPGEDGEPGDSSEDKSSASEDEGSESQEDKDGDDDSESEDEDSEDSDSDDDARIPKARLDKEIEKVKKARAKAEEAQALVSQVQEKLNESQTRVGELEKLEAFARRVWKAAEYMPRLKDFLETNPIFTGKEPSIDDFDSPEAYAAWVKAEALEQAGAKPGGDESLAKEGEAIIAKFNSEIDELRKGEMAKYLDEPHLEKIREFVAEQGLISMLNGKTRFDSIEKIARYLFLDEMSKDIEARGRKEAVNRMDKARKTSRVPAKGQASPGRKPLRKDATLREIIRETIADSQAGY